MNFKEFMQTVANDAEPGAALNGVLQAMWWAAKGDWEASHNIAQDIHNKDGSWVHAYLHRVEGDLGNASYWYNRAGQPTCTDALDDERDEIIKHFLTVA